MVKQMKLLFFLFLFSSSFIFVVLFEDYCEHEIRIDVPCHKDYTSGPKVDELFFLYYFLPFICLFEVRDLSGVFVVILFSWR